MARIFLAGAALGLALTAGAAQAREPGAFQLAQVTYTPQGCHWIDSGDREQTLWCRDEDGIARRTSTRRQDTGGYDAGCPRGQLDNGVRCVPEAAAIRAQAMSEHYDPMVNAPPPFDWQAAKTPDGRWRDPNKPDIVIIGDGHRWRRSYGVSDPYGY